MQYKTGFWNYFPFGHLDNEEALKDWKEMGFNMPMTFHYNPENDKPEQMLSLLDGCQREGMQAIVCDVRTRFSTYMKVGKEAFIEGVKAAVKEFGSHPANFGFYIGDEPAYRDIESAIEACKIVNEYAPDLTNFINLFPYWEDDTFSQENALGAVTTREYKANLDDFVKRSGVKILAYDCYGQCTYFQKEKYRSSYFRNLRIFGEVARENGIELWTSLLCIGHFSLRVPTADDMRWQLSTAFAHGATGVQWFAVYKRGYEGTWRGSPFDEFGNKTETYARLARETRIFKECVLPYLEGYKFDKVWHHNLSIDAGGGVAQFEGMDELKFITYIINPTPAAVTRFVNDEGKVAYAITNLSSTEPTKIRARFDGPLSKYNRMARWYAPGQIVIYMEDGVR